MTPIRKGTPPTPADFEAVIDQHVADMRSDMENEYGPDFVALLDAEREAAAKVFEAHRLRLDVLRQRAETRAEGYAEALNAALRNL